MRGTIERKTPSKHLSRGTIDVDLGLRQTSLNLRPKSRGIDCSGNASPRRCRRRHRLATTAVARRRCLAPPAPQPARPTPRLTADAAPTSLPLLSLSLSLPFSSPSAALVLAASRPVSIWSVRRATAGSPLPAPCRCPSPTHRPAGLSAPPEPFADWSAAALHVRVAIVPQPRHLPRPPRNHEPRSAVLLAAAPAAVSSPSLVLSPALSLADSLSLAVSLSLTEVFQEEVQDTASVGVSDEIDALQLMRNDMIPTEVDVSTSRRDDVSSVGIIIDSESNEDVEVMDYSSDENEFMSNDDDTMAPGSQQGRNPASRNSSNVNSGGNVVPSQTASTTNSHVFDQISSQVVIDPTTTLSGQIKKGRGKAKNVALDQYLAKSNGIKPKVNIPDGKLKPVGAWAAEFTTELGIICRTYAPIRVVQWKKVEQKDKEKIYNLIRVMNKMLSRRFKGYKHELHKYYQTFNSHDEACEKPFNDVSAEDWEFCCQEFASAKFKEDDGESVGPIEFWKKTHYTEKGWKTPMAQQLYEEMIEIQSQPSPMIFEDEIYKEVMDKKSGYARGRGILQAGIDQAPSSSFPQWKLDFGIYVDAARNIVNGETGIGWDLIAQTKRVVKSRVSVSMSDIFNRDRRMPRRVDCLSELQ
ncbi:hypothetical protein Scep_024543 [Stephania cephalantha]|uniref:Uncharacterized protein n=1 Tax=Stephania cephalantha TaxID=152367 RepID=A0AAP0HTS6_9MAGN